MSACGSAARVGVTDTETSVFVLGTKIGWVTITYVCVFEHFLKPAKLVNIISTSKRTCY